LIARPSEVFGKAVFAGASPNPHKQLIDAARAPEAAVTVVASSTEMRAEWHLQSRSTLGAVAVAAGMIIALQTTTAFVAGVGRGYLPPLGWAVLTLAIAQVLGVSGWAAWFPWAVPVLVVGSGPAGQAATGASVATVVWWLRADQTG